MAVTLIEAQKWDAAFSLIERYSLTELHGRFLREALYPALASGRTASVKRWLTFDAAHPSAAITALGRAEIAYREGRFAEAEAIADAASHALGSDEEMLFAALFLAGRAAHTGTMPESALAHYQAARRAARNVDEECRAVLGEIGAAADLELPSTLDLLSAVRQRIPRDRLDLMTVWISRSLWCDARFARPIDLDAGRWGYQLLSQVNDPIARTAFRNLFSYMLVQAGAVDEARAVLSAQREEAESLRLTFVEMYADHVDALHDLVIGDLESAHERLERLERSALASMDNFLLSNVISFRTRLLVACGRFDDAVATSYSSHGPTAKTTIAEIQASRALAFACGGRGREAIAEANASANTSQASEVLVLGMAAVAVVAILEAHPDAPRLAEEALSAALYHRVIEPFLTACRGCPELCAILFRSQAHGNDLRWLTSIAKDLARFEPAGEPSASGTWKDLSPREQEVLSLVALGMSNREIARHLYISNATTKVHVSHILAKLGVRSRTEAALRAPPRATPPAQ